MSAETREWLSTNTLIGFTEKRGNAWHYRAGDDNHFAGAVPLQTVEERLFAWEPEAAPLQVTLANGTTLTDHSRKVIVRPDTEQVLGIFKNSYQPHGYQQWLVQHVADIVDSGDLQIGSAGLLRGGAVAWVQFELPETMQVAGVAFRPFITSATSLDGSLATTYTKGAQIVVCDNTLTGALADGKASGTQAKRKHTSKSLTNIQQVRDQLGILVATTEDLMAEIDALAHETVSDKIWTRFLDSVAKVDPKDSIRSRNLAERKREALQTLWTKDERVAPWAGTAYGVVAAMNTYGQHVAHVRGMSRPERNMLNMVTGEYDKTDNETLRVLRAVATA